ncbi:MAG TPA: ferritin-like domain-containing protein, partial [Solirubrobacteraceae bacterium]|nr:ferritin-like domain-containing protein [Solirubrobacteraceae bacterium]
MPEVAALPVSRRRVLGQGLGATLALAAGPVLVGPAAARAQAAEDGPIIAARVGLEQNSSYAYGLARAQAGLPAPVRALLDQIHAHETQHVGAMLTLLAQVGGAAPLRPTAPSQLDPITRRLALARGRAAVLTAAVALEQASVASYYAAARD